MERKLSTILAADVVGFSKMMESDEVETLRILKQRRKIIDGIIAEYGGVIFGSAGDSIIAEFASPIKATECGVQFQGKMQALNEDVPDSQKMLFRVGINIGDVMVSEGNLFGDAVNIASRLESEAKPSGICLSKNVVDMVGQKLKISFEDAGELNLKNIEQPVQAFFIIQSRGGVRWVHHSEEPPQVNIVKAEAGSIAVMLFKNLSKDEEQAYFCEGFSEDLVAALSRFKKLVVVSGNASFSYRDSAKSPKQIGQELGVRYIVEGSVRKLGPKLRINSTLISVSRENTVWSNNFDTTIEDIFDIQDELVKTIVSTVVGRIDADAVQQVSSSRPENLAAYDLVLKGLEYHRRSGISRENAEKAYELFEKAIEVDPSYARAHAWRACSYANVNEWNPGERPLEVWLQDCIASVERALEIDPDDPEANRIMGSIKLANSEFESSRYHHEKAKELCPSDAYILARYATFLIYVNEPKEALETILSAKRIDPFCPDILFEDEGMCYYWLEDYNAAIESFNKLKVPTRNSLYYLAASLSKNDEKIKAAEVLKQAVAMSESTIETFVEGQTYKDPKQREYLRSSLESISI